MAISVPPGETAVVAALLFCIFYLKFVESRYAGSAIWLSWEYDPGFFCEGLADHAVDFLREPINTYSCFSYIAVGLWVLLCAARDYQQPSIGAGSTVRSLPGLSVLGAATALAHGLGAMFNHACRCHVGHRADVCTMYTLALYFTMVNAVRFLRIIFTSSTRWVGVDGIPDTSANGVAPLRSDAGLWLANKRRRIYGLCSVSYGAGFAYFYSVSNLYYSDPRSRDREAFIMVALIGMALGFDGICRALAVQDVNAPVVFLGMVFALINFLCHVLTQEKVACEPHSAYQLYGVSQICGAAAFGLFYHSLRTEKLIGVHVTSRPRTE